MGQLGDLSPQGSVAIGILVGLLSTSVQSLGLTMQRKSHMLEDDKGEHEQRRPPYRRGRWQLGMLMFVVANLVGSTIQITTLPLPVLSTLQASGLVFNTAFATLILGEPFTRYSFGGTLLVCAGAVLIAVFGAIGEPAHNLKQLLVLLGRHQFLIWLGGTAAVVIATIIGARALKQIADANKLKDHSKHHLPSSLTPQASRLRLYRGLAYGFISGVLSAHSLLIAKSAVELLVRTIVDRVNQFNRWQSWMIVIALIFFALTQLYYMHQGLKLCSTSVLYPFVFCIYNIIAILDGLIYFNQSSRLSPLHAVLIAIGTVILLVGVLALSWRLDHQDPDVPPLPQPQTPLTPGMGLIDESHASPRVPQSHDEESLTGERQPLLTYHRRPTRKPTLSIPPPDDEAAQIWAELDDDDAGSQDDVLASLPHTPSIFLVPKHRRQRSRGNSLNGSASKVSLSSASEENVVGGISRSNSGSRRSKTWGYHRERRRRSAPLLPSSEGNGGGDFTSSKLNPANMENGGPDIRPRSSTGVSDHHDDWWSPQRGLDRLGRWWKEKGKQKADEDPGGSNEG